MATLKSLRASEADNYHLRGFTKVGHKIFTDQDYQDLKSTINEILVSNGNKETTIAIGRVHVLNPEILFWVLSDNVLDICEDILGPNIGLFSCALFYKKAHTPDKAYWHTDTSGLRRYNLVEDTNLLNLTLSFSRTDAASGCLRYLPGTHLTPVKHDWLAPENKLITYSLSVSDEQLDLTSIECMELGENEGSIHNVNVVHGSEPNLSDRDRITLSCRFFSATNRCYPENFEKNGISPPPFLVRGHDLASSGLKSLSFK